MDMRSVAWSRVSVPASLWSVKAGTPPPPEVRVIRFVNVLLPLMFTIVPDDGLLTGSSTVTPPCKPSRPLEDRKVLVVVVPRALACAAIRVPPEMAVRSP